VTPRTVEATLSEAAARFRAAGIEGARFDASRLLSWILERDAAWLLAHPDASLSAAQSERIEAAIARRAAGEPVAYIVGSSGFFGRTFAVDVRVLVPRPETEAVVEAALACVRAARASRRARICDVGTGSGAIAVSLACELPDAELTAVDISESALAVARANAQTHGVARRIRFVCGDGLRATGERFTCVVANLPYVRTAELAAAPDPTSFEPRAALDGGPDGLDLYRALLDDARQALEPEGTLVMEAGPDTVPELARLTRARLVGRPVEVLVDYAGLERLVIARPALHE
jgi:release factor glutamine methyltransferase